MEYATALTVVGGSFLVLLAIGLPVAFTFLFILLVGSLVLIGSPTGPYASVMSLFASIGSFSLTPIPLFVLMGEVLLHSGLAVKSLDSLSRLIGRVPARLSILSNMGGALFGLLSGSTMASTAVLGTVLTPEMQRRGYHNKMIFGPIVASGSLAMIIPPSNLTVIYGTVAQVPIGHLLIAGIIPGILIAINYSINILLRVKLNPSLAPGYELEKNSAGEKLRMFLVDLFPLTGIIFLVTGIFIIGVATPNEAAALGALGTVVMAAAYKKLTREVIIKSIKGTVTITTMTLLIIGGSEIFSQLLSYSGLTRAAVEFAVGLNLPPYGLMAIMILVVLLMGCIMESVPIIMITVPLYVPIAAYFGWDPIWFGMVMLLCIQVGLITPPFGLLLFVMRGVAPKGTTFKDVYVSALPFVISDLITISLLISFPFLATWLPKVLLK